VRLGSLALPSAALSSLVRSLAAAGGAVLKLDRVDGRTGTLQPGAMLPFFFCDRKWQP
jgi:hypothetical protein